MGSLDGEAIVIAIACLMCDSNQERDGLLCRDGAIRGPKGEAVDVKMT